jgi:hypothetical protein
MWRCVGVPNAIATEVGGKVEVYVWRTIFTVVAVVAAVGLLIPQVLDHYDVKL